MSNSNTLEQFSVLSGAWELLKALPVKMLRPHQPYEEGAHTSSFIQVRKQAQRSYSCEVVELGFEPRHSSYRVGMGWCEG